MEKRLKEKKKKILYPKLKSSLAYNKSQIKFQSTLWEKSIFFWRTPKQSLSLPIKRLIFHGTNIRKKNQIPFDWRKEVKIMHIFFLSCATNETFNNGIAIFIRIYLERYIKSKGQDFYVLEKHTAKHNQTRITNPQKKKKNKKISEEGLSRVVHLQTTLYTDT